MHDGQSGELARNRKPATAYILLIALLLIASVPLLADGSASATNPYESVTFAQNDSPTDPVYVTQTENSPTALTLFSDISPAFSNPGYSFVDWNTEPDGSGTSYSNGEMFDFTSSPVLYAVWSGVYQTVTFAENDGPSDTVNAIQTDNTTTA
ncbi:MAG TPA: hypothetical protein VG246_09200, partial [Acidimicrobiales bacterium]|nr:hypothetical protein [Acidimicrobiales bacterium]